MTGTDEQEEEQSEEELARSYKTGVRVGQEQGVRLIRDAAARAFTDKKDDVARLLRSLADDLERFIDK